MQCKRIADTLVLMNGQMKHFGFFSSRRETPPRHRPDTSAAASSTKFVARSHRHLLSLAASLGVLQSGLSGCKLHERSLEHVQERLRRPHGGRGLGVETVPLLPDGGVGAILDGVCRAPWEELLDLAPSPAKKPR